MKTVIVNKKERELEHKDGEYYLDGEHFDGHFVLWGFSYEPKTYLKESELSGEEWRKGGEIKFFRNNVQVYEQFSREPNYAAEKILHLLRQLQDLDWDKIKEGAKIYWKDTPALISRVILEQGAMIIKVDGVNRFPDSVWAKEDWQKLENPREVKIDFLDPHIWWFR